MAVRFDGTNGSDRLAYTAATPPATFTVTFWAYLSVDRGTWSAFFQFRDSGDTTVAEIASPSGTSGPFYWDNSSGLSGSTGWVVGEWRKIAITRTGSTGKLYSAATGSTEVISGTVTTGTPDRLTLGARGPNDNNQAWNGRLAYVRIWDSVLTQSAIEAEWASATPVITSGIWANWPLATATDLTDTTAGRVLTTGVSAVTTEADPTLGGPASVTGTAAATLGALTAAATGTRKVLGTAAASLGALSATATGTRKVLGTAAASLGGLTATATGTRTATGTAAASLGGLSATATGTRKVGGTATAALGGLTSTAGSSTVTGTAAASLGRLISHATGTRTAAPRTGGRNWGDLRAILAAARLGGQGVRRGTECPNDGVLLQTGPGGVLYCPFDGWRGTHEQAELFHPAAQGYGETVYGGPSSYGS